MGDRRWYNGTNEYLSGSSSVTFQLMLGDMSEWELMGESGYSRELFYGVGDIGEFMKLVAAGRCKNRTTTINLMIDRDCGIGHWAGWPERWLGQQLIVKRMFWWKDKDKKEGNRRLSQSKEYRVNNGV